MRPLCQLVNGVVMVGRTAMVPGGWLNPTCNEKQLSYLVDEINVALEEYLKEGTRLKPVFCAHQMKWRENDCQIFTCHHCKSEWSSWNPEPKVIIGYV
jgi:hypothetical protein